MAAAAKDISSEANGRNAGLSVGPRAIAPIFGNIKPLRIAAFSSSPMELLPFGSKLARLLPMSKLPRALARPLLLALAFIRLNRLVCRSCSSEGTLDSGRGGRVVVLKGKNVSDMVWVDRYG